MLSVDAQLRQDFEETLLEMLVPNDLQRHIPSVRELWQSVLQTEDGSEAFEALFIRVTSKRCSVDAGFLAALQSNDASAVALKNLFYDRFGKDPSLVLSFFDRPITYGNEQCPFWNDFAYSRPPRHT